MESWKIPTILLCLYGFFKGMKPSESFLEPYLVTEKNISQEVLDNEVWPVWTYSYLTVIILVFLLTDLLRYKVVLISEGFSFIATWALLIWAKSVIAMQFMQFTYGIGTATEIAYFAYIYAVVPQERYKVATGIIRAILLVGKCISSVVGQVLISTNTTGYLALNYISFASVSVATVIAFFIPKVTHSTYFHHEIQNELHEQHNEQYDNYHGSVSPSLMTPSSSIATNESISTTADYSSAVNTDYGTATIDSSSLANVFADSQEKHKWKRSVSMSELIDADVKTSSGCCGPECSSTKCCSTFCSAMKEMLRDFIETYSNRSLLAWSIWWAIATCGDFQVLNYAQNLWDVVGVNRTSAATYNGAVDAISTLIGASCAFGISHAPVNWEAYGELALALVSLMNSALLIIMARTTVIWIAYGFYALFRASYQTVITVATFQIAKHLEVQRYGLIFGFNTFMALVLQAILTASMQLINEHGHHVGIRTKFVVNGGYFGVMGLVFFVAAAVSLRRYGCVYWRDTKYEDDDES